MTRSAISFCQKSTKKKGKVIDEPNKTFAGRGSRCGCAQIAGAFADA
jgi:hypothetical protein